MGTVHAWFLVSSLNVGQFHRIVSPVEYLLGIKDGSPTTY